MDSMRLQNDYLILSEELTEVFRRGSPGCSYAVDPAQPAGHMALRGSTHKLKDDTLVFVVDILDIVDG